MGVRLFDSKKHRQKAWGYEARIAGKRKRKVGFSSKQAAELALSTARIHANERAAGVRVEAGPLVTVRQLVERRRKQLPVAKGQPGYYSRNQAVGDLNRFLALLDTPLLSVHQLKTAHLALYRDARLKAGLKPQTVFRELTNVLACLNRAHESFPALDGWRPPRRPRLEVPKHKRQVTYAPDVAARLLAYLRRPRETTHPRYHTGEPPRAYRARLDAADYLQMALQCGQRGGEIRTRRWADVLWHKGALRVDSTKTADEGVVFLPASLLEMLRRRKEQQHPASVWIFPSDKDHTRPIARGHAETCRRAARALGIAWGYQTPGGVVFHTARHTAATTMLDSGSDVATVQAQMGWSDRTMLLNYGHASARSRRAAASALDAFSGAPEPASEPEKVSAFSAAAGSEMPPLSPMSPVEDQNAGGKTEGKSES